ncbi:hypothetical protein QZM97_02680 [Burkholderia orbicola]|uniref:hypothetical protein n=1 Tax=Burkholderia orbicola TaxID=2978683 RepID=UPI00264D1B12|nr:hypothetical protein [Burkholderia orbicola]MDN7988975.1 hypothetical protein [Burkholderia orbicola]
MTTENSRADALTPCVHADDPKACYRVRCQLGGKCVDDDMSPRQPAAAPIHPDDEAVDRFSIAMKAKLAEARAKGRSGWETCDPTELSIMLREHVEKGDPRDVANFCMFLWALGKPISDAALPMGKRAAPSPADDRAAWDNARDSLAVAPMPPNAQLRRVMDLLDTHLGDSDLMLEGMTQEEIEEEFPVVAAMQIVVGLYQKPPTESEPAPSPADERAALSEDRIDWIANAHCPNGTAYPVNVKNAIREALREARINFDETGAEGVAIPTEEMRLAMTQETPYFWRRSMDKSCYEVGIQTNDDWREVISDDQTILATFDDGDAAADHFDRLEFAWRYVRMLEAAPQPAQADARVGLTDAVVDAAKAVVREALDSVSVHPCDEHDDEVRARQLPDYMQKLYRALLQGANHAE